MITPTYIFFRKRTPANDSRKSGRLTILQMTSVTQFKIVRMIPPMIGMLRITLTTKARASRMKFTTSQMTRTTHFPIVTRTIRTTFTKTHTNQQKRTFRQSVHQLHGSFRQRFSCWFSHVSIGCSTCVSTQS